MNLSNFISYSHILACSTPYPRTYIIPWCSTQASNIANKCKIITLKQSSKSKCPLEAKLKGAYFWNSLALKVLWSVKIDANFLKVDPQYPIGRSLKLMKIMMVAIWKMKCSFLETFIFQNTHFSWTTYYTLGKYLQIHYKTLCKFSHVK
jgi:hypothetical protein